MKMMGGIMMGYCFFLPVLLIGCGLPNYASIDPPTVVSTGLETTVAFRTPADDQNINGYIVYYKIYTSDSDYSDAGASDAEKFNDETSYSNNEIPMGETVPKQRGFFRVGKLGQSVFSDYTISHSSIGANTTVLY